MDAPTLRNCANVLLFIYGLFSVAILAEAQPLSSIDTAITSNTGTTVPVSSSVAVNSTNLNVSPTQSNFSNSTTSQDLQAHSPDQLTIPPTNANSTKSATTKNNSSTADTTAKSAQISSPLPTSTNGTMQVNSTSTKVSDFAISADSSTSPSTFGENESSSTTPMSTTPSFELDNEIDSLKILGDFFGNLYSSFGNTLLPNTNNSTGNSTSKYPIQNNLTSEEIELKLFRFVFYNWLNAFGRTLFNTSEPTLTNIFDNTTSERDPIRNLLNEILTALNSTLRNSTDADKPANTAVIDLSILGLNYTFDLVYRTIEELLSPSKAKPNESTKFKFIYIHKLENETILNMVKAVEMIDVLNRLRPKNVFLALLPNIIEGRQKIRPIRRIIYNSIQELVEWTPLKVYNKRVKSLISFISEYPERARERVSLLVNALSKIGLIPQHIIDFVFKLLLPFQSWMDFAEKINDIRFKHMPFRKLAANIKIARRRFVYMMKPRNLIKYFLKALLEVNLFDFENEVAGMIICLMNQTCAFIL